MVTWLNSGVRKPKFPVSQRIEKLLILAVHGDIARVPFDFKTVSLILWRRGFHIGTLVLKLWACMYRGSACPQKVSQSNPFRALHKLVSHLGNTSAYGAVLVIY